MEFEETCISLWQRSKLLGYIDRIQTMFNVQFKQSIYEFYESVTDTQFRDVALILPNQLAVSEPDPLNVKLISIEL